MPKRQTPTGCSLEQVCKYYHQGLPVIGAMTEANHAILLGQDIV